MGKYLLFVFILLAGCSTLQINADIKKGDQLVTDGNLEEAVIYYEKALVGNPDDKILKARLISIKRKYSKDLFDKGILEFKKEHFEAALDYYKGALKFDLLDGEIFKAIEAVVQKKAINSHMSMAEKQIDAMRYRLALEELNKVLFIDSTNKQAKDLRKTVTFKLNLKKKFDQGELSLTSMEPVTLRFNKTKLKEVISVLAKISKLNIVLDADVKDKNISIYIKDAPFHQALELLLVTNKLFMKKINDNTILLAPKNKQKQADYSDMVVRTFYLNYLPVKDAVNLLRTILEVRKVFVNTQNNSLVLRDTSEKISLAEKIIEANDRQQAEVMVELEILEITETDSEKFGWEFTQDFSSVGLGIVQPFTLDALRNAGADEGLVFSIPGVVIDFLKKASNAKVLAHPSIRIKNGTQAKITVGDKVPIELSSSTSQSTTSASTGGVTTSTSIEFKDVGITLEATPNIHFNDEISMELAINVTSLGDKVELSSGSQFRFGERKINTQLTIGAGETIVIGGLIREENRTSESSVPFFSAIPLIGKLFSGSDNSITKTDIIITITPHIIKNLSLPPESVQEFWSGTERVFSTKPLFAGFKGGNAKPVKTSIKPGMVISGDNIEEEIVGKTIVNPDSTFSAIDNPAAKLKKNFVTDNADEQGYMKVMLKTPSKSYKVGDIVSANVELSGGNTISDLLVSVRFDSHMLTFLDVVEGGVLKADNWPTAFISSGNTDSGVLNVRTYRIKDESGSDSAGKLFNLRFKAKEAGSTHLVFERVDIYGPDRSLLSVETQDAIFMIE